MRWIRPFFIFAGFYDFVFGLLFLFGFKIIYQELNLPLPNHDGYVQFAAALVTIFGIAFWMVALDPWRNRNIILLGILLKLSYSGIVLGHYFFGSIPWIWVPFAWVDLIFAAIFVAAWRIVRPGFMQGSRPI